MIVRKLFSATLSRSEYHELAPIDTMLRNGKAHLMANPRCPECNGFTYRVHRRYIDLIRSTLHPIRRYRCAAMACPWEGNLPKRD